ncbi:MAG: low molecular weight protein-tyrosine-phosphatase [Planctomycetota bacterium]|nr:low molecular weight protein-tyrosine-phosphatase [Planctomycetota bacterium]
MGEREKTGVLFVCLGNICRSPLAEGVFLHLARERGAEGLFVVESCGTGGWHVGELPDRRSQAVAKKNGIVLPSRARKLDPFDDFRRFEWIIAMDRQNRRDVIAEGGEKGRVHLLRSFDATLAGRPEAEMDVPDPYYGADGGFDEVFEMVMRGCEGLLERLRA